MLSNVFVLLLFLAPDDATKTASPAVNAEPASKAVAESNLSDTSIPLSTNATSQDRSERPSESLPAANATSPAPEKWTLSYRFSPGMKLRYQTDQTMTLEARLGGNRKVDVSELKQKRVFTVLTSDEWGATELAMQFEHVWMRMQTDDREPVVFDSTMKASEVPNVFRHTAHQLKGSAPRFWLSSRGTSQYEARKARADAREIAQVAFVPSVSASDAAIKVAAWSSREEKESGTFLIPLPEKPVGIGDAWSESNSVPIRVTAEINRQVQILRTYRLDSVENGIASISFRSSIESSVKGPAAMSQLIQATPRGTVQLDLERGLMLRRELRFNETVIGAFGAESILSSVGSNTEQLIE